MKVYEAVVDGLAQEGVTHMFGLMGDGNMLVMSAAESDSRMAVFHARHEGAALTMACGAVAAAGGVGVATVTCGPGVTQLGTALTDAVRARTPLVVLAGDLDPTDTHINQFFIQRPFIESTGSEYLALADRDSVAEVVALAFHTARSRQIPVVLSLPLQLQDEEYEWDWMYTRSDAWLSESSDVSVPADVLASAAKELAEAERPVIVAGQGAMGAGVRDGLIGIAEHIGALCATTLKAKGLFAGAPLDAGIAGAFSTRAARELLAAADVVLAVGASLNYFTTEGGYLFPEARVISVDLAAPRYQVHQRIERYLRADARTFVPALLDKMRSGPPSTGYKALDAPAQLSADSPVELQQSGSGGVHPVDVVRAVDRVAPDETAFVVGVGHFWSFPIMYLTGRGPDRYHVTQDFGSIGQGLPTAIGFALARPDRPTILFEGDGSLLMHIQELESLSRHPAPVLVLVMNDGAFGAEVHKLRAKGLPEGPAVFGGPDFAAIAQAFGLVGTRATTVQELDAAVRTFLTDRRPTVVDVRIAPDVVSGPYLRTVFGQEA